MIILAHFILLVAVFALRSNADGSYLGALQKSVSDPVIYRPQKSQIQQRSQDYHRPTSHYKYGHGNCRNDYHFDYIKLTLQWSPGVCTTSPQACIRYDNRLFSIHGMWPQFRGSYSPAFCCFDNTFNYKLIQQLLPDLNKYWFSLYNEDNRSFWSHEWLKHGTCLRDVKQLQGEKNFFGTTVGMVSKMPILQTLAEAKIIPSDKNVYQSIDIQNVLRQLTGGNKVRINCDLQAHQPIPVLTGLDFCYDSNLKLIDCPPNSRCQRQVYFFKNAASLR